MRQGLNKLTAILLVALMLLAVLPVSALGTEQYSDPVMPGISLTSILPGNTKVVTYVFQKKDVEISRQSVKNGDTLVEPDVQTGAHEKFVGWEPEVTFGLVSGISETKDIIVNANIEEVYYVFFQDAQGRVVATKEGKPGETISNFDDATQAALSVIPLASDEGITGWKNAAGDEVTSVTLGKADVTLTAKIEKGYWITFESNGGSYIAPQFYAFSETAAAPAQPTKPGYTFEGWYTDAGLTAKVTNFANIKATTTVYANWTPAKTKYTVIHWWENANDDEYSYHESETKYGYAGGMTSATGKTYRVTDKNLVGETVTRNDVFTAQNITQQTIKGDGSTIVNVYYTRKKDTLSFGYYSGFFSSTWNEMAKIEKKYGQDISADEWPKNGSQANWKIDGADKYIAYQSTMPLNGGKLLRQEDSGSSNTATYYVETLNGQESGAIYQNGRYFKVHHEDKTRGTAGNTVGEEDRYPLTGFENIPSMGTQPGSSYKNAKFYYARKSYNIVYYNGDSIAHTESYKYEQDISGAGTAYVPTTPPTGKEGYIFDGWYADPERTLKYEFSSKVMPAYNIIVYAKWVPPVYTVIIYAADKKTVLDTITDIPQGSTISEEDMPMVTVPDGSEFLGWVNMEDNKPFNFDTKIMKDYSLYAKVGSKEGYTVVYDANGGAGAPTDQTKYAVGSGAVVQPKGDMTAPADDPDKAYFLGWAKTADAETPDYQPGETMEIVATDANAERVITLYAVWGPKSKTTTLTYNANYEGANPMTVEHLENGSATLPNNATVKLYGENTFTRPGYKLIGWAEKKDAVEPKYNVGQSVIVDTVGENVLYAVWKKSTVKLTITKRVTGIENDTTAFTFNVSYQAGEDTGTIPAFILTSGRTSEEFELPIGAVLTIVEGNAARYTTTAQYGSTTATVAEDTDKRTITGITVNETDTSIVVTNAIKTGKLTIVKEVTGSLGDKLKKFDFTCRIGGVLESASLANGESKEMVEIPYGTEVTITEKEYTGYETSYKVGAAETAASGLVATVTIQKDEETVTFINHKDAQPDTGVLLDSLPYILIIACVAAIGAFIVIRRRKNRED